MGIGSEAALATLPRAADSGLAATACCTGCDRSVTRRFTSAWMLVAVAATEVQDDRNAARAVAEAERCAPPANPGSYPGMSGDREREGRWRPGLIGFAEGLFEIGQFGARAR